MTEKWVDFMCTCLPSKILLPCVIWIQYEIEQKDFDYGSNFNELKILMKLHLENQGYH